MKKMIVLGVLCCVTFIVSALVHTPATFAIKYVPMPAQLSIDGVSGTIWNGQAEQVRWQGEGFGQVHWHFEAMKLLQAKAEVALRFGKGSQLGLRGKGYAGYSLSGAYVENTVISLPAEKVLDYSPVPVPVSVDGQLELTIERLIHAQPYCSEGNGTLAWSPSPIGSPLGELDLGPVIAKISCQDSVVAIIGDQSSKMVTSEFSAQLNSNNSFTSKAWFKPLGDFPVTMQNQLKWLGNPDGQGRYQFNYAGRL